MRQRLQAFNVQRGHAVGACVWPESVAGKEMPGHQAILVELAGFGNSRAGGGLLTNCGLSSGRFLATSRFEQTAKCVYPSRLVSYKWTTCFSIKAQPWRQKSSDLVIGLPLFPVSPKWFIPVPRFFFFFLGLRGKNRATRTHPHASSGDRRSCSWTGTTPTVPPCPTRR